MPLPQALQVLMEATRKEFGVPGIQLGLIKDGKVVFAGACGVRDLRSQEPVTVHSSFHMASVAKPFVAMAVMQLVERGALTLEDRLVDRLPGFRLKDPRYRDITLRQVLAHTSGLPDVSDYGWDRPEWDEGALARYIRSLEGMELLSEPGSRHRYSNVGYNLLAGVIAQAAGTSFERAMSAQIFQPLGMGDSTFLKGEIPPERAVTPHRRGLLTLFRQRPSRTYPYHRAHAGSSTLHASVGDMLQWCQANLGQGPSLLTAGSLVQQWTPQADTGLKDAVLAGWEGSAGLGWFLGTYQGVRLVSHRGADPGFRAAVMLLPDRGMAVVAMGNADSFKAGRLARAALDLALR